MSNTKYYCKCFFFICMVFFLSVILPCDNIPPIAYPEASVVRTKGWEKSGRCKSGSSHNFDLKISKAICCLSVHMNGVFFFRSWLRGLTIFENLSINLRQYPANPKNYLTFFYVFGTGNSFTAIIFWGSGRSVL